MSTAAATAVRKAAKAREASLSAVEALREELRQLEAKRAELVEQKEAVEAAPVDKEMAERRVTDLVAALATKADLPAGWLAQPTGYVETLRHLTALPAALGEAGPPAEPIWPVLALVMPDALTAALRRRLEEIYARLPSPMTDQERRAALAAVERELAEVERQAAEAWWAGLDAGFTLPLPNVDGAAMAGLEPAST
jgi:hypothetical protein